MSVSTSSDIEQLTINTIRGLSMDAVQAANSGHPGTPMALAPVAYSLWNSVLRFDPTHPEWAVRDRFVLSCGHASMLLYSILHLAGVQKVDADGEPTGDLAITLDDIRNFRQLGSVCAGHPEHELAPGIETTTGPLGQGISNSVGMAIAASWLAARFNRPDFDLFDFNTYALCGDGDLMEGIGYEAASLAGHLKLSNLCWIYDDNKITIEGSTDLAFGENIAQRFEALGWRTTTVSDANDIKAIGAAYELFAETDNRPTLIVVKSIIGYGAPNKANTSAAHGSPLGEEEISLAKEGFGWNADEKFNVPAEAAADFGQRLAARGQQERQQWEAKFAKYEQQYTAEAAEWKAIQRGELPADWDDRIPTFETDAKGMATRASSGKVLNAVGAKLPWLLGGSADLEPSTKTALTFDGAGHFQADSYDGRNFHFGIREHAMASIANGMSLTGLRPYVATFFVFSDYLRPAMRLSAVMGQPVLYIFTHDSIGVGEDGPTHQPVEQLAAARAIPGLVVLRPCDANEVAEAYRIAIGTDNRPVALVLTRQNLPTLDRSLYRDASGVARGGYVLADCDGQPEIILIGTGSEVSACIEAHQQLTQDGVRSRVVSMPSCELFEDQDDEYRQSVLPAAVTARIVVEAGVDQGWWKYLGTHGRFIGMNSYGQSGPAEQLMEKYGFTGNNVLAEAKALLGK